MAAANFKKSSTLDSNWIVALAAFWVNFCLLGVHRSHGVIYSALVDVFGVDRETAAWPSGLLGFFMCITGALSGILSHYISIKNLAIFGSIVASLSVSLCSCATKMQHVLWLYGATQGIGIGMIVPLTHVILNQNFTKYRALALGIAYSGSCVGSFIFPPVAHSLYCNFGLHGTFLLLGGIMLHSLMGAILYQTRTCKKASEVATVMPVKTEISCSYSGDLKTDTEEQTSKKAVPLSESGNTTNAEILKWPNIQKKKVAPSLLLATDVLTSPAFFMVSAAYAIYFSCSAIFLMVVIDFAGDRGVPISHALYLIPAFSLGDLFGRLGGGWFADRQPCVRRRTLVRLQLVVMGGLMCLMGPCPNGVLAGLAVALGLLNGSVIVNHSVLLTEYLGLERLPLAMGFSTCLVGMTAFLRPYVIGVFRDRGKNYDHLFLCLGLFQIAISVLWFFEVIAHKFVYFRQSDNKATA